MTTPSGTARRLSFLHTAEAHVSTFDALVDGMAPGIPVRHLVARDILEQVLTAGGAIDATIRGRIAAAVEAAAVGGDLVVCTCSTLGGVVEEIGFARRIAVLRIDRALAEAALTAGGRVLIAMTAASTFDATRELFEAVALEGGSGASLRFEMIEGVFDLFLSGRTKAYGQAIGEAVRSRLADADVIVLAQASMAAGYPHLSDLGLPILVSGPTGVARALSLLGTEHE